MSKCIDLTGQKFNYWYVLKRVENSKDGRARWLCRCKCGKEKIVDGKSLRSGHSKSCGCYKSKVISKIKSKDLTNKRFGLLVAIEKIEGLKSGSNNVWKCKCDCGNFTQVSSNHLLQGNVQSCGCVKSRGEQVIAKLLLQNNIPFSREKEFKTCVFKESGYPAKFDFYVNDSYLIEYDGEQHYSHHNSGWSNENNLIKNQTHDMIKNEWCKSNNITLIRIPYTHLQNLCIEDLVPETSKYKIE